jgi:glycosyltransferase involved in cell wall biosynthesis
LATVADLHVVVPWYPTATFGGAESLARNTILHLRRRGVDARVLTTCVPDFRADWGVNALPAGPAIVDGVPVERFPVDRRDWRLFDQVNLRIMRGEPPTGVEARVYVEEGIRSRALERHLAGLPGDAVVLYLPYLYGTTYWGMQARPGWLLPCLHDEPYAHLPPFQELFAAATGVLCNAQGELDVVRRLFGVDGLAIGTGVDTALAPNGDPPPVDGPYLLCVARKDHGKNVEGLVADFARVDRGRSAPLRAGVKLVLLGAGALTAPPTARDRVVDLGRQPEAAKRAAFAGALAHVVPGMHESFSLVLMEAWLCGAPALVNARSDVTREHVRAAAGGLAYDGADELGAAVEYLLADPERAKRMARNGAEYVRRNFEWDVIVARLRAALGV